MYFTTTQIGEKRHRTPEGFLVCLDVPLARTGEQLYRPHELPPTIRPKPGTDYIRVMRDADEVFRRETLQSAEGKPLTIGHPDGLEVTPKNYRQLAVGHMQNIRRGAGADHDVILGDLLIKDEEAISLVVDAGVREISLGYDCEYYELGEEADLPSGLARQAGILINHAAILDAGRCGPRCAIGDHSQCQTGDQTMTTKSLAARIRDAFASKDQSGLEAALGDLGANTPTNDAASVPSVTINNHMPSPVTTGDASQIALDAAMADAPAWAKAMMKANDTRFAKLEKALDAKSRDDDDDDDETAEEKKKRLEREKEKAADRRSKDGDDDDDDDEEKKKKKAEDEAVLGNLQMEAPTGVTGDAIAKAIKTNDSAFLAESFEETIAAAEILAPGIRVPTFDAKVAPRATFDAICGLRRRALDFAMRETGGEAIVAKVTGGRLIDAQKATCGDVRTVFNASVALKKASNNGQASRAGDARPGAVDQNAAPRITTIAELNAFNAARRAPAELPKKTA